jgi:hypothetical protein
VVGDHYVGGDAFRRRAVLGHGRAGLAQLAGHRDRPADPENDLEPVDSSAAAIAAQGLLRLGRLLESRGTPSRAGGCSRPGLSVTRTLLGRRT